MVNYMTCRTYTRFLHFFHSSIRFFSLLLCCFLQACGGLKLVDIPKSTTALQLTTAQQQEIHPKLKLIRDIVDDYDFEKKQLEVDYQIFRSGITQRQYGRYESGFMDTRSRRELNAFRDEARKFLKQREIYLDEIKEIVGEIAAELTPEQRLKLAEMRMPKLDVPVMLQRDPYNDLRYLPSHPLGGVNVF